MRLGGPIVVFAALVALTAVSCEKDSEPTPEPTLSAQEPTVVTNAPVDTPAYVISMVEGVLENESGLSTECLTLPESFVPTTGEWLVLCSLGSSLFPAHLNPERVTFRAEHPDLYLFFPEDFVDEHGVALWWGDQCCELGLRAADNASYGALVALGVAGGFDSLVNPP